MMIELIHLFPFCFIKDAARIGARHIPTTILVLQLTKLCDFILKTFYVLVGQDCQQPSRKTDMLCSFKTFQDGNRKNAGR